MRPFRERNPVTVGAISLVVLAVVTMKSVNGCWSRASSFASFDVVLRAGL